MSIKKPSAKQIKKSLIKPKAKLPPNLTGQTGGILWTVQSAAANEDSEALWDAFEALDTGEFCQMIAANPPSGLAVHRLISKVLKIDNPQKTSELGHAKAQKLAPTKTKALEMWAAVKGTAADHGKTHFARTFAKKEGVTESTVRRWLTNK